MIVYFCKVFLVGLKLDIQFEEKSIVAKQLSKLPQNFKVIVYFGKVFSVGLKLDPQFEEKSIVEKNEQLSKLPKHIIDKAKNFLKVFVVNLKLVGNQFEEKSIVVKNKEQLCKLPRHINKAKYFFKAIVVLIKVFVASLKLVVNQLEEKSNIVVKNRQLSKLPKNQVIVHFCKELSVANPKLDIQLGEKSFKNLVYLGKVVIVNLKLDIQFGEMSIVGQGRQLSKLLKKIGILSFKVFVCLKLLLEENKSIVEERKQLQKLQALLL